VRVIDGVRGNDGDAYRVGYLVALAQATVMPPDCQRDDGSYQRTGYGAEQGVNDELLKRSRPCGTGRPLKQLCLRVHGRVARGIDILDVAICDSIGDRRCISGGLAPRAYRNNIRRCASDLDFAAKLGD
jgi:hypothetical protein